VPATPRARTQDLCLAVWPAAELRSSSGPCVGIYGGDERSWRGDPSAHHGRAQVPAARLDEGTTAGSGPGFNERHAEPPAGDRREGDHP
jgi:hypothetical protein